MAFLSRAILIVIFSFTLSDAASASLVINVSYSGDVQFAAAFTSAKSTWESHLFGYRDGLVLNKTSLSSSVIGQTLNAVNITAIVEAIDGAGGRLGEASPTEVALDGSGFILATDGLMRFDSADMSSLSSEQVNSLILHEMAHVLGFGTLWDANAVYAAGSGEFMGLNATNFWQSEFGQSGTPDVELQGGLGTADGHWNENLGGAGLTGITDSLGRDMRDELMTGWLNPNSFISNMTVASFADIGFRTSVTAVPEPGTNLLMATIGAVAFVVRRRRRSGPAAAK